MMVILDPNNDINSRKFPLFEKFVDLISRPANMIWGAHAVSRYTLVRATDLKSLGHLRHMVETLFHNRVGGVMNTPSWPPPIWILVIAYKYPACKVHWAKTWNNDTYSMNFRELKHLAIFDHSNLQGMLNSLGTFKRICFLDFPHSAQNTNFVMELWWLFPEPKSIIFARMRLWEIAEDLYFCGTPVEAIFL